ncbi:MAG: VTT domain-containing protein [Planctomycetes bacterium]|nr:VTT domain-containing protein [Planctomycetota bacterium]
METIRHLFHYLKDLGALIEWGGLTALVVIIFAETGLMIGFFLPGDSLLVTAGLFAARGSLNILWLNLALMAAAIVGDAVGFWTGRQAGHLLYQREDSRFFKKKHLLRAKKFYEKHGAKTIVLARFVPIIRTFAPIVAGAAEMPYRKFVMFNVLGGIGWVASMTLTGYMLGIHFPWIVKEIHWLALAIIIVSFIPVAIEVRRARAEMAEEARQEAAGEKKP